MTITALEIQEIRFSEAKKGYDPGEVDDFLERIATDVDTLNRALSEAASRIKSAETRIREAEARAEEAEEQAAAAQAGMRDSAKDQEVAEKPAPAKSKESEISEQDISNAFIAAQKSAEAMKEEARKEADRVYREAESKGRDIVREALAEKQKTLGELDRLRESCEHFRTEYLSLLKHFQSDAQKRLTDFDDIIPRKATDAAKTATAVGSGNMIKDNDAAVAAAPVAAVIPEAAKPASAAPEAVAPTMPPASGMLEDVDDLDIEEID
jgi:cell division initiation protein